MQRRDYISVSSLETYSKCPMYFNHKYLLGTQVKDTIKEPLILGSLAHSLLEHKIGELLSVEEAAALSMYTWVSSVCNLPVVDTKEEMAKSQGIHLETLLEYANPVSDLLVRAAPTYHKQDKIRKNDGTYIKNPLGPYSTKAWSIEYNKLKLNQVKLAIDSAAAAADTAYEPISLANVCAWALFMAKNFRREVGMNTLAVEWDFGPGTDKVVEYGGYPLKGSIDWVVELDTGEIAIIDHKTGKKPFHYLQTAHHRQLNIYAYVWYEINGKLPDLIAVSSPYWQKFYWQQLDIDTMYEAVSSLDNTIKCVNRDSNNNTWYKYHPNDYNTPCIEKSWETGEVIHSCPYLHNCWPNFKKDLDGYYSK